MATQRASTTKGTVTFNQSAEYLPNRILAKGWGCETRKSGKQLTFDTGQQTSKRECKPLEASSRAQGPPLCRGKEATADQHCLEFNLA